MFRCVNVKRIAAEGIENAIGEDGSLIAIGGAGDDEELFATPADEQV